MMLSDADRIAGRDRLIDERASGKGIGVVVIDGVGYALNAIDELVSIKMTSD